MNPIQESKQELEASIRYAENAIAKAKQAIEQAATYQEQTGREQALQNQVGELKSECALLAERIDEMKDSAFASANTIKHLKEVKQELESKVQGQYDDIKKLEYDLVAKTAQANAWKKKYYDFKETLVRAGDPRVVEDKPTMPVIPKAVAIAIFREGMAYGACRICDELENASDVCIEEREYYGHFEVSFNKEIDLSDELDLDYLRESTSVYDESSVIDALSTLCADKEFECRIHGVDDTTIDLTKKNDE